MHGLPDGVTALNEEPFNIGGKVAWCCDFPTRALAEQVLEKAFPDGSRRGFSPTAGEPGEQRARVTWEFGGESYGGDVLVDVELRPVGFLAEVHLGEMAFDLAGYHIPYPRFPAGFQQPTECVD